MIERKENGEILYTYLDEHFEPRENLSPYALMDKWRIVPGRIFHQYAGKPWRSPRGCYPLSRA